MNNYEKIFDAAKNAMIAIGKEFQENCKAPKTNLFDPAEYREKNKRIVWAKFNAIVLMGAELGFEREFYEASQRINQIYKVY